MIGQQIEIVLPPGMRRAKLTRPYIVMMSGGGGSWAAARRIAEKYGPDQVTLVFTDVKGDEDNPYEGEDEDTYRFLLDASADVGAPLVWITDGRGIWDVFEEKSWLGNSKLSHCSWELKTRPARRWMEAHCSPSDTTVVVGMDWTEADRHTGVYHNYSHTLDGCAQPKQCKSLFDADGRREGPGCKNLLPIPWRVSMPMVERPLVAKPQVIDLMRKRGLRPPRMYAMGFAHANCIGCVKGGHAHWSRVLQVFPDHYAYAERREAEFRAAKPGRANVSILKDRSALGAEDMVDPKKARPLTLREFRERVEQDNAGMFDLQFDWGGCGCANDPKPAELAVAA